MKGCKKRRASNGYAIVEVIIAMTIITAVSISAIAVASMTNTSFSKTLLSFDALTLSDNIIECYKYADSQHEFEASLITMGLQYEAKDNIYTIKKDGCRATVIYSRTALSLQVFNVDNKLIHEDVYRKAAA